MSDRYTQIATKHTPFFPRDRDYFANLKTKYTYSKHNYKFQPSPAVFRRQDFIEKMDRLSNYDTFSFGKYHTIYFTLNDINVILQDTAPEHITQNYLAKMNNLRKKMDAKISEYSAIMRNTVDDEKVNENIFYNLTDYATENFVYEKLNAEMCDNEWIKIYDVLRFTGTVKYEEYKNMRTFHIYSSPGSISAVNHLIKTKLKIPFDWTASATYDKQNNNIIGDDYGLYKHHPSNFDFGILGDGDLSSIENMEYYMGKYVEPFALVTAECGQNTTNGNTLKKQETLRQWHQFLLGCYLDSRKFICELHSIYDINVHKIIMVANYFFSHVTLYRPQTTSLLDNTIYLCCRERKDISRSIVKKLLRIGINNIFMPKEFMKLSLKCTLQFHLEKIIEINYPIFVLRNIEYVMLYNARLTKTKHEVSRESTIFYLTRIARNARIHVYIFGYLVINKINDEDKLLPPDEKKSYHFIHDYSIMPKDE